MVLDLIRRRHGKDLTRKGRLATSANGRVLSSAHRAYHTTADALFSHLSGNTRIRPIKYYSITRSYTTYRERMLFGHNLRPTRNYHR